MKINDSQENAVGIDRAMELRLKLYDIANSYAGDVTGDVAIMLHEACNCILRAKEMLDKSGDVSISPSEAV